MKYIRTDSRAIAPTRAHTYDAGLDIYALEEVKVNPGEIVRVKTGIHVALKQDEVGLFWDKSGRAAVGLTVLGGCIDGPYRGELEVVLYNCNLRSWNQRFYWRNEDQEKALQEELIKDIIKIPYGKAITQLLVLGGIKFPVPQEATPEEWVELANTERGTAGFGSTDTLYLLDGPGKGMCIKAEPKELITYFGNTYRKTPQGYKYVDLL